MTDVVLDPKTTAFFFDFDGTLAPIVDDPTHVRIDPSVAALVRRLEEVSGAVAVISGRSIAQLDNFLSPLVLPASGVHGLERRSATGALSSASFDPEQLKTLATTVAAFTRDQPGLITEVKPGSVALHYRKAPEKTAECLAFAALQARRFTGASLAHGKQVVEIKLGNRDKGDAVLAFMSEPPFQGRTPVFIGDDVTDEDAFRRVVELGGVAIKIGSGDTVATHRTPDITSFHRWLARLEETDGPFSVVQPGLVERRDGAAQPAARMAAGAEG